MRVLVRRRHFAAARPGQYLCYNVGATGASMTEIVRISKEVTGHPIPVVQRPQRHAVWIRKRLLK